MASVRLRPISFVQLTDQLTRYSSNICTSAHVCAPRQATRMYFDIFFLNGCSLNLTLTLTCLNKNHGADVGLRLEIDKRSCTAHRYMHVYFKFGAANQLSEIALTLLASLRNEINLHVHASFTRGIDVCMLRSVVQFLMNARSESRPLCEPHRICTKIILYEYISCNLLFMFICRYLTSIVEKLLT